eukprot:COSAG02_NODE_57472_length_280_cov_1.088398_2_plen_27_part_01
MSAIAIGSWGVREVPGLWLEVRVYSAA